MRWYRMVGSFWNTPNGGIGVPFEQRARLRMWLRHSHLGKEWAGPFPFTPNPARERADGARHD